ncbi:hypothetical protein NEOC65_000317 [Neochlamydia sp. AcF65]|nr:hypothetical protein [Neochlamydia sp. AcF65]
MAPKKVLEKSKTLIINTKGQRMHFLPFHSYYLPASTKNISEIHP